MNYLETIRKIREVSLNHPYVRSFFYGSDSVINPEVDINYPLIAIVPAQHTIASRLETFNFGFIFADRLRADRKNKIQIQSNAIIVLKEIVNTLVVTDGLYFPEQYSFSINVFEERFSDECAGAFCDIQIRAADIGECIYYPQGDCCGCDCEPGEETFYLKTNTDDYYLTNNNEKIIVNG